LCVIAAVLPFERTPVVLGAAIASGYVGALLVVLVLARGSEVPSNRVDEGVSLGAVARATASVFLATLVGGPLVVVVERAVAAGLAAGSIALLTFARNLALVPLMISQALANGIFPVATVRRGLDEHASVGRLLVSGFRVGVLVSLSASAFLVICRRDIVRIALQRGALTPSDANAVAQLLVTFSGAVVALAVSALAARALFALGRYRFVTQLSALSLALYVVLAVALGSAYGRQGLAIAFLLSAFAGGTVAAAVLLRAANVAWRVFLTESLLAPLGFACVFAAGAYAGLRLSPLGSDTLASSIGRIVPAAASGLALLAAAVLLVRGSEYRLAVRIVSRLRHS
jgi:peptidoglycan biosynthesis protein MviN/MurJ (putative lipid II flippase)